VEIRGATRDLDWQQAAAFIGLLVPGGRSPKPWDYD
jgi:hypothetical protein